MDGQAVDWMMCSTLSWFSKIIVLFTPRTTVMCTGWKVILSCEALASWIPWGMTTTTPPVGREEEEEEEEDDVLVTPLERVERPDDDEEVVEDPDGCVALEVWVVLVAAVTDPDEELEIGEEDEAELEPVWVVCAVELLLVDV